MAQRERGMDGEGSGRSGPRWTKWTTRAGAQFAVAPSGVGDGGVSVAPASAGGVTTDASGAVSTGAYISTSLKRVVYAGIARMSCDACPKPLVVQKTTGVSLGQLVYSLQTSPMPGISECHVTVGEVAEVSQPFIFSTRARAE